MYYFIDVNVIFNYPEGKSSLDTELDTDNEENIMPVDNDSLKRPASTLSSCSSSSSMQFPKPSTSFNSTDLKSQPTFKCIKKIVPEIDEFAKKKKEQR